MDRKTVIAWIFQGFELKRGEKLFIPCETKAEVAKTLTIFRKELEIVKEISPNNNNSLVVRPTFKDSKFWVVLTKEASVGNIAFKKKESGEVVKVILNN